MLLAKNTTMCVFLQETHSRPQELFLIWIGMNPTPVIWHQTSELWEALLGPYFLATHIPPGVSPRYASKSSSYQFIRATEDDDLLRIFTAFFVASRRTIESSQG